MNKIDQIDETLNKKVKFEVSYYTLSWFTFSLVFLFVYGIAFYSVYENPYTKIDMYGSLIAFVLSIVYTIASIKRDKKVTV